MQEVGKDFAAFFPDWTLEIPKKQTNQNKKRQVN
jgi:hypothetical protein